MPPGMNGADASKKIKSILHDNKLESFIACLTSQREGDFAYNKSLKYFDKFYSKPITAPDLREIVMKLFNVKSTNN